MTHKIENADYYSFFLFSKLFDAVKVWKSKQEDVFNDTDTPYDELYGEVMAMYQDYVHSEFNDEFKPEYECMVDYLSNKVRAELWKEENL